MITRANAIANGIAWCLANPGCKHSIPTRLIADRMRDVISMTDIQSIELKVDTEWVRFLYSPPSIQSPNPPSIDP
jgi:hypothetical protein